MLNICVSVYISGPEDEGDFCINIAAFVVLVIAMTAGLVVSGVSAGVITKKFIEKTALLKQIGAGSGY